MSRDFLTNRTRTKAIIGSGNGSGSVHPKPKLIIYGDDSATDNIGGRNFDSVLNDDNFAGNDVFMYVSGAIDGKENSTNSSVSVFGGDLVVSGTLYAKKQVIEIEGVATGSLTIDGGINSSGTITANDLILTSGSINVQNGSVNIGPPEDSSYTDGLFTDFTSSTPIGTAVDRFNEVLKALAPAPAPSLDFFDVATSVKNNGITAKLSFGDLNDQSSASPAYISVNDLDGPSESYFSAKNVNDDYGPVSSADGNHILGIYNGTQVISGTLNEDVTSDTYSNSIVNYPDNAFGSADQGSLKLFLNGNEIHSTDLTSFPSGNSLDNNSGFINLSAATPAKFASDTDFINFKYRTGGWQVGTADQVNGRNYVQVKHVIGATETVTGFAEWVNDDNADALTMSSPVATFTPNTGSGATKYLSGVEYYKGGSITYAGSINNFYKYVYGTNPITFSTTSTPSNMISYSSQAIPTIGSSEDHTKIISISVNDSITLPSSNRVLGGSVTTGCTVQHPFKSTLSGASTQATVSQILIDNAVSSSDNLNEYFTNENFRLISGNYATQNDTISTPNQWDSTTEISTSGGTGYSDALMTFDDKIISTNYSGLSTVNNGNFSTLSNGPSGNPDYSTSGGNIASGHKYYYRKIQNDSGSAIRDLSYTITGNATLRDHNSSLSSSNNDINIHFKHPGTSAWLDAALEYDYHEISSNDDGCSAVSSSDITTNIVSSNRTNYVTFGTSSIPADDYLVARIKASNTWTGNIEKIQFNLGLTNSNTVTPSPSLSQIDTAIGTNTALVGVVGKLSFGSNLTKSGYTNVGNLVNSTTNANSLFNVSGTRLGIFNKTQNITGTLNNNISANGQSYPADAWGNGKANLGTLRMEVNGVSLPSTPIDLTVTSISSGTYFNLTDSLPGKNSSNPQIPDHRYYYRTGTFNIPTNAQRDGWNYARVIHNDGTTDRITNYIEWVNSVSNQISFSNEAISNFTQGNTPPNYLSGIQYFVDAKADFTATASNVYKYVYSNASNAITFPTNTNCSINSIQVSGSGVINGTVNSTSRSLPNLDVNVSSAAEENITITGNFSFNSFTKSLPPGNLQNATLKCNIKHPISGNTADSSEISSPNPLMYTVSNSSTTSLENFSSENYRLKSGSYSSQSDVAVGTGSPITFTYPNSWDSTQSLVGNGSGDNAGHNDGLQVYNDKLIMPSTNFNNTSNMIGPQNNPNYAVATGSSGIATRTYYRYFQNTENSSITTFDIKIKGTGTNIVSSSTGSLSSSNIFISVKLPNTSNGQSTGFLDIAKAYDSEEDITQDGSGCLQGDLTSSLTSSGVTNKVTFGVVFVPGASFNSGKDKNIVVKIQASKNWTGNLDEIEIIWNPPQP